MKRKILSLVAIIVFSLASLPAMASYVYVNGQGSGITYAAARSQAIYTASLYCSGMNGTPTGNWTDTFQYQDALGNWTVSVTGACFIQN